MNISSTNSWLVHGMKGCSQFHFLAVGSPEEHFFVTHCIGSRAGWAPEKHWKF